MSEAATEAEPGAAEIEAGRKLFRGPVEFLISAAGIDQLPASRLPEVAFAGRSNVGKSSLLNALAGRRALARVSNTPGRTRQINFFRFGPNAAPVLLLADLPGYGYARASKAEIAAWTTSVDSYLRGRPNLRRVIFLVDCRRGVRENDLKVMEMLDAAAVNYQIVLTKADKLKADQRQSALEKAARDSSGLIARHPRFLATSALKKWGLEELRAEIALLAQR